MLVRRTYTCRVWNTLGCLQDSSETWMYVRMYGIVINSERPYFDSTWKNTTRLSIRLFHIMTAFRREPCELLTINAIIVKQHRFYPNIKIIRLKRHYLPLGLLLVLPQWWGDARWREKSASSCFKSRLNARPRWLEVSLLYFADFCPTSFSQINSLGLEDFLCYSKIIYICTTWNFSLILNSQIWANNSWFPFFTWKGPGSHISALHW